MLGKCQALWKGWGIQTWRDSPCPQGADGLAGKNTTVMICCGMSYTIYVGYILWES